MKVKTRYADGETLYRVAEFSTAGIGVQTPVKAVELHKLPSGIEPDKRLLGVSEFYRSINRNQLSGWMTDGAKDRASLASVRAAHRRARERASLHALFLQVDSVDLTSRQIEFLSDTVHANADIVAVPIEKDLHLAVKGEGSREFKRYLGFARGFVEEVEKLNGKPLMAMMPSLPWQFTQDLSDLYLDLGMRMFCFDFAGRTPSSTEERNIRPFLKRLREEHIEEEVILYALNANTGRASKAGGTTVAPAKDILSFGFGFDVLGQKHLGLKGPREMYEQMAKKGPQVRLFDKDSYGYRKAAPSAVASILPADTAVRAGGFRDELARSGLQGYVNMEQHAFEARRLQRVIKEAAVPAYLSKKGAMDSSDRSRMKDARQSMTKKETLDEW